MLDWLTRLYPVPPACVPALLGSGVVLGVAGDALLRAPDLPGLNLSVWIAMVGVAALLLHRRAALAVDRERVAWLLIGVALAAGLAWRDALPLRLLALGCATLAFALAAHRLTGSWMHQAGVVRYAWALALGALHAWTAAGPALVDAWMAAPRREDGGLADRRVILAVVRGLVMATPLLFVFGSLFVSADAVFENLVFSAGRFDVEPLVGHLLLFSLCAWIATGYLRGFLTGTQPRLRMRGEGGADGGADGGAALIRPTLGITEGATVLAALDLLFLAFVAVQLRYLFGGDALVQVTPALTYAEYARRGFFELVAAVVLVVPILLAADWLVTRRTARDVRLFRVLAGLQIGLVLAIAASAFQRLRLYHAVYGLTELRFYAMVLLLWIGAMLLWLAATVLRGRRESFAYGALVTGIATVALLFVLNPDALVARTNLARLSTSSVPARFDVAYATTLSADAVPVVIAAMPALPGDVQCALAENLLRRWPPDRVSTIHGWNWSTMRASHAVRQHEAELRSMAGSEAECAARSGVE
jgi:hypothetical protein